jgi:pullulanase/glycogen debranching enzyme
MERDLRETDFIGCGWPELSIHGTAPWQVDYSSYNRLVSYLYCGNYVRRADRTFEDNFYVMFNMHWEKHEFELPKMEGVTWEVMLDTAAGKQQKRDDAFDGKCIELTEIQLEGSKRMSADEFLKGKKIPVGTVLIGGEQRG